MKRHTKNFGIYYWDTFDGETILLAEFDTMKEVLAHIAEKYGDNIKYSGADCIDIVDKDGNIIANFPVG